MATAKLTSPVASSAVSTPVEHAVSWPAIFAGATAAASISLILIVLGLGLGLTTMSPWAGPMASEKAITFSTILWISFASLVSSGLGGYIAGRLRVRWPQTQPDEVYFRDTAHGFLAWGIATLVTAAVLSSVIGSILGVSNAEPVAMTEEMRKNAAYASLWVFFSLLLGAFTASLLATFGGRQRDLP
ncbi:MAG: hypothetical protein ABW278_06735 [Steroidobacteraceae bacterium]